MKSAGKIRCKMRQKILLSIIVPVYNVEPYLKHFFCTLLCCNLNDCEIILSLGRSSDESEQVCTEYARSYPLIKMIYQNGEGLSNARNCALDIAGGEYVLFLDSDDFVESADLDSFIADLRNGSFMADLIVTDFRRLECPSNHMTNIYQIGENTPVQRDMRFLPRMLRKRQCFWNVWRYLFRLNFLREHQIRFWENRVSEDVDFVTSVFLAEPRVIFVHCPYYVYVVGRGGSLMDSPNIQRLRDTVFVLTNSIERLRASNFIYAPQMIAQFQFEYLLNLALAVEIEMENRKEALELYRNWETVLADSADPAVRFSTRLLPILRRRGMATLLHCIKIMRRRWKRGTKKKGEFRNDHYEDAVPNQFCGGRK